MCQIGEPIQKAAQDGTTGNPDIKRLKMYISTTPKRKLFTGAIVAASMLFAHTAFAKDGDVQIGKLECDVAGGIGMILGSKKK
ncbi:MAG: hypothetical protein ACI92Z_003171 [Paracoccaceae bacterium]|jgi:hypothetical protein